MKDLLIIFDAAHGKNVPGKRSPDERVIEYLWSRERIHQIMKTLKEWPSELPFEYISPYEFYENEPGLITRVNNYNGLAMQRKKTVMLSLHLNATVETKTTATGFEFWTSVGKTEADNIATQGFDIFKNDFSNEKMRAGYWEEGVQLLDPDKEKDFTILAGYKSKGNWIKPRYEGILLESMFMTNKSDVDKLLDPIWLDRWNNALIKWVMAIK